MQGFSISYIRGFPVSLRQIHNLRLNHLNFEYKLAQMEWLNYHHLLYFWVIAREGSMTRACEVLNLSQPALSAQLRTLEDTLGEKLFNRVGRTLVLTDVG